MHHLIGTFIIGALAGGLAGRTSRLRPVARRVVRAGIVAKQKIENMTTAARQEMEKLVAEARADLDQAGTEQHG
jgi:hypothetical protein